PVNEMSETFVIRLDAARSKAAAPQTETDTAPDVAASNTNPDVAPVPTRLERPTPMPAMEPTTATIEPTIEPAIVPLQVTIEPPPRRRLRRLAIGAALISSAVVTTGIAASIALQPVAVDTPQPLLISSRARPTPVTVDPPDEAHAPPPHPV